MRMPIFATCGLTVALYTTATSTLCAQITAPILPGISVEIADVLQFSDTRGLGDEDVRVQQNVARINFLRELPDESNRWFVNDLRGDLYLVDATTNTSQSYLSFRTEFPRFRFGSAGLSTGIRCVAPSIAPARPDVLSEAGGRSADRAVGALG